MDGKVEIIGFENLDRIIEKTGRKMETAVIELSQDLSEAFVVTTPYVTGFLRSNWYADLNNPNVGEQRVVASTGFVPRSESEILTTMALALLSYKGGDTVYFKNTAFYAGYVEYGTSKMAPRAWVRSVLVRLPLFVENVCRRLKPL